MKGSGQPGGEKLALEDEFLGEGVVEVDEELTLAYKLGLPLVAMKGHGLVKFFLSEIWESRQIKVLKCGGPADLSLMAGGGAVAALHDPLEDTHVFSEAGPNELAVRVFTKPVDVKNPWEMYNVAAHF